MMPFTLFDMFESHQGRQIDKWRHYFPIYEKHFERYRNKAVRVLEIGIDHGGSLQLWKRYFGPQAEIVGIDINPAAMFEEPQIKTYCIDQTSPLIATLGPFDIIIDDGSHKIEDQEASFRWLWRWCRGVYLIEDCHHHEYPDVDESEYPLMYKYPWVIVLEKPRRMIRGTPSRELRPDEAEAKKQFG